MLLELKYIFRNFLVQKANKLKLVIITNNITDVVKNRFLLIKELVSHANLTILSPNSNDTLVSPLVSMGVHFRSYYLNSTGVNPLHDLKTRCDLVAILREINPDVVLAYTIKAVIWGSISARKVGVKKIYSMIPGLGYAFLNSSSFHGGFVQKVAKFLYKRALRGNQTVFFQNADDEFFFKKKKIITSCKKTILLPGSGVDINHYPCTDIPQNTVRFLMVARLLHDKGVLEYIAAAKLIEKKYPKIECYLAGFFDQNPRAINQEIFNSMIAKSAIRFVGKLDDVRHLLSLSSVFVLPSYREGVPRSTLEAMSMGRPVITTDAPGCRETVVEGVNGFLVPVKDVDALVVAMEKMIQHPDLIQKMGLESRRMVEERFDVRIVNQKILSALELI